MCSTQYLDPFSQSSCTVLLKKNNHLFFDNRYVVDERSAMYTVEKNRKKEIEKKRIETKTALRIISPIYGES